MYLRANNRLLPLFLLISLNFFPQSLPDQVTKKLGEIELIRDDSAALRLLGNIPKTQLEPLLRLRINHKIILRANSLQKLSKAITLGNESVEIAEKNKLDSMEALFNKLLGISYYFMDRKLASVPYFEKAIRIAQKSNFWELEASCYNNIGGAFADVQRYDKAEANLLRSMAIMKEHRAENKSFAPLTYRVLARVYSESNREAKAEPIYLALIEKCKQNRDTTLLCDNLIFYSEILTRKGEFEKALAMSSEALNYIRIKNKPQDLQAALAIHAVNLKAAGRYAEALGFTEENSLLLRQTFAKDLEKQVSEVEVKYKTAAIIREKQLTEIKAKRQKQNYILMIIAVILSAVIALLFWNLRKNATQKLVLQRQKLETLIEGEEKERVRIAKDLHDGIIQDLTAIKIKVAAGNSSKDLDSEVDRVINEVRGMSYQMMPVTLKKYGLVSAVEDLLQKALGHQNIKYEFEAIDTETEDSKFDPAKRLPEKIEICLYRVFQELLNNIIRHSEATFVSVYLTRKKTEVTLICEDNGKGFDEKDVSKGIGMTSIASRVEMQNGTVSFQSPDRSGAVIIASIPF